MDKQTVLIISAITTGAVLLWDIYLWLDGLPHNTISAVVTWAAHKYPLLPFGMGVLIGHWFA